MGGGDGIPSDYLVLTQQLWLFCCWGCGCCWAVTITSIDQSLGAKTQFRTSVRGSKLVACLVDFC